MRSLDTVSSTLTTGAKKALDKLSNGKLGKLGKSQRSVQASSLPGPTGLNSDLAKPNSLGASLKKAIGTLSEQASQLTKSMKKASPSIETDAKTALPQAVHQFKKASKSVPLSFLPQGKRAEAKEKFDAFFGSVQFKSEKKLNQVKTKLTDQKQKLERGTESFKAQAKAILSKKVTPKSLSKTTQESLNDTQQDLKLAKKAHFAAATKTAMAAAQPFLTSTAAGAAIAAALTLLLRSGRSSIDNSVEAADETSATDTADSVENDAESIEARAEDEKKTFEALHTIADQLPEELRDTFSDEFESAYLATPLEYREAFAESFVHGYTAAYANAFSDPANQVISYNNENHEATAQLSTVALDKVFTQTLDAAQANTPDAVVPKPSPNPQAESGISPSTAQPPVLLQATLLGGFGGAIFSMVKQSKQQGIAVQYLHNLNHLSQLEGLPQTSKTPEILKEIELYKDANQKLSLTAGPLLDNVKAQFQARQTKLDASKAYQKVYKLAAKETEENRLSKA